MNKDKIYAYIEDLEDKAKASDRFFQERNDLYIENQQLKKQKDDVVEGLKDLRQFVYDELVDFNVRGATETHCKVMNLLRMLGEIDDSN